MGMRLTQDYLAWKTTAIIPEIGTFVLVEGFSGSMAVLYIDKPVDEWGDNIAKWAYLPIEETKEEDTHDDIERQLDEIKDAIHRLEYAFRVNNIHMDRANNKLKSYLNEEYKRHTGEWNVLPDECWRGPRYVKIKTSGDDTPESSVSGPEGEVSIDELGKIFSRIMQNKEFREAYEREKKKSIEEIEWDN